MTKISLWQEASINPSKQAQLGFVAGLVVNSKCHSFERILFHATRGNMYFKRSTQADFVADPASGEQVMLLYASGMVCSRQITLFLLISQNDLICDSNGLNQ